MFDGSSGTCILEVVSIVWGGKIVHQLMLDGFFGASDDDGIDAIRGSPPFCSDECSLSRRTLERMKSEVVKMFHAVVTGRIYPRVSAQWGAM